MSVKITIHVAIEITDDGRINVAKASWTPSRSGGDRRPVRSEEITAIAAAVIRTQTTEPEDPDDIPDSSPIIDDTMALPFDEGPPAHARGNYVAGPGPSSGPPRPAAAAAAAAGRGGGGDTSIDWAVQCLVGAGVTAVLARQLATASGPQRAAEIGVWMRDKTHVRNKDAMAMKLLGQQNGGPKGGRVV